MTVIHLFEPSILMPAISAGTLPSKLAGFSNLCMLDGGQESCLVLLKCDVISEIWMSSTTFKTTMIVAAFASLLAMAAVTL